MYQQLSSFSSKRRSHRDTFAFLTNIIVTLWIIHHCQCLVSERVDGLLPVVRDVFVCFVKTRQGTLGLGVNLVLSVTGVDLV